MNPYEMNSEQAWHYRIVPDYDDQGLVYLTDRTGDELVFIQEELEFLGDGAVRLLVVESDFINQQLHQLYPKKQKHAEVRFFTGSADRFLPELIAEAERLNSSDIHIEHYREQARVRIRIDGQMIECYHLTVEEYPAIINKIKILAALDIAEKRLPQDGRIHFAEGALRFDIRVSILPTLHAEKIVLRLLSKDTVDIDIMKLGLADRELSDYLEGTKRPSGMILISGPTGSGKTTTLYATLKLLNSPTRNIVTIEDPIEYTLEGINQVQLKESIGLSFSSALRTFLRQDPDVIMIGEIRDVETANMAIRASLTGHLVLSTIHTNSAWGTISRLIDMGVPSFLLANTLNTSVAQRLVRLLCPLCKKKVSFTPQLYPTGFAPPDSVDTHFIAQGCSSCYHTGYSGRKAVYEVIPIDSSISALIKENAFDISEELTAKGIKDMKQQAFQLFALGHTSMEEIYPLLFNY